MSFMGRIRAAGAAMAALIGGGFKQLGPLAPFWYMDSMPLRTKSKRVVTEANSLEISAVYACVRVVAETVASLPLHVFLRRGDTREQQDDGTLVELLNRPNGWQNGFEFVELMVASLMLRGNFFAAIIGHREQLWPIHPDRVEIEQDGATGLLTYVVQVDAGEPLRIPQVAMLHIRGLSSDGIRGLSPITLARESLGLAKAAEEYGAQFFGNSAKPSGIVTADEGFDPNTLRQVMDELQRATSGENQHKLALLPAHLKWQQIGLSHEDSQFLETRKYQDVDIARILRVPPHKIGILDRATFSNIEHQGIEFVQDTILPICRRIESALDESLVQQLVDARGAGTRVVVRFVLDGLLRGDSTTRAAFYSQALSGMWMTRNEVRRLENLPPVPGGDEFTNPHTTSGGGGDAPPADPPEDPPPGDGEGDDQAKAAMEALLRMPGVAETLGGLVGAAEARPGLLHMVGHLVRAAGSDSAPVPIFYRKGGQLWCDTSGEQSADGEGDDPAKAAMEAAVSQAVEEGLLELRDELEASAEAIASGEVADRLGALQRLELECDEDRAAAAAGAAMTVARWWVQDVAARLHAAEVRALDERAGHLDGSAEAAAKFKDYALGFYGRHQAYAERALAPLVEALGLADDEAASRELVGQVASAYIDARSAEALGRYTSREQEPLAPESGAAILMQELEQCLGDK